MADDITNPPYLELEFEHSAKLNAPPQDLIYDDGAPLESNRHRIAMNVLINSTLVAFKDRPNLFAGGNMFVYYSDNQAMNRDYRGPDFFVVLDVDGSRERKSWVVWNEAGRYPDVIVEFLSPSTAHIDTGIKKELYEQTFRTRDYFVYDPFDSASLRGWHLSNARYQPLTPNDRGWLWCKTLNLWLGTWQGQIQREPGGGTCSWLRFYSPEGELIPLSEELAQSQAEQAQQRAEQERQRAEEAQQQAEQERQRAEEAQQQAEQAQQQAEEAQQQAEQERQRAEEAQQQAEQAQQQAEQERQRAARLAARLRELGEDPNGA